MQLLDYISGRDADRANEELGLLLNDHIDKFR